MGRFLTWWLQHHPGAALGDVRLRHVSDYLVAEAERGMSPATIHAEGNGLRIFFGWLVAEEQIVNDPTKALVSPRRVPGRIDVYSPAEAEAILAHTATPTDLRGRQRHAIVATLRYSGARAGEVPGLRLDRLDLEGHRFEVLGTRRHPDGGHRRGRCWRSCEPSSTRCGRSCPTRRTCS